MQTTDAILDVDYESDATGRALRRMLSDLAGHAEGDEAMPSLSPLSALVEHARRAGPAGVIDRMIAMLDRDPALGLDVRAYCARLSRAAHLSAALADLAVLPAHGMRAELRARLVARVLPSLEPPHDLHEILAELVEPRDATWLAHTDRDRLARLLAALTDEGVAASWAHGTLRAIELTSHRLATAGEEPVLGSFDPEARDHDSPFLAQAEQVLEVVTTARRRLEAGETPLVAAGDTDHARVMLTQCREAVSRLRARAPQTGVTFEVAYALERIEDLIGRLSGLLAALSPDPETAWAARAELAAQLAVAQAEREHLRPLLTRASRLVSQEIASRAARTGEHYIARTAREWGQMWLRAGGAGLIVATMAVLKVAIASLHAPPLIEALLFSANYGAGFVLVGVLGLTIATKQPAMTAATLAGSVDDARPRDTGALVSALACTARSQLAAIVANCVVAAPAAWLASYAIAQALGAPVASTEKARQLVEDLDPIGSLALPHAALTGVYLAASGIVAGYVATAIVARHVPDRLRSSRSVRSVLGASGAERMAGALASQGGAIAGSIVLGVLLGSTGTLASLLGLPLDIRHVSFASANLGLSAHALGTGAIDVPRTIAGIAGIGALNLAVSFSISLALALHARRVSLRDVPTLGRDVLRSWAREPLAWVLPVGVAREPEARE